MEYIAYLHKDKNSEYGVSFPDSPGKLRAQVDGAPGPS